MHYVSYTEDNFGLNHIKEALYDVIQTTDFAARLRGHECPKKFWQNFLKLCYNFYYDFTLVFMQKKVYLHEFIFFARARAIFGLNALNIDRFSIISSLQNNHIKIAKIS